MFSDNEIGILYENGSSKLYEKISFERIRINYRKQYRKRSIRYHTQFQEGKKYEKKSFIFITVCRYDSIVCLF